MSDAPLSAAASPAVDLERSLFYGVIFTAALYGLEVYMFFHSLYLYCTTAPDIRRSRIAYIIIGGIMLSLITVTSFANIVFMQFMWIDHRDFPGGPLAYLGTNSAIWWQTFGTASNQVTNFLGDGVLIYRCFIIWQYNWLVIVLPVFLYLGSISMAIMMLTQSALPGSHIFQGKTVDFGVPWIALSVTLNVVVTILICFQILKARRVVKTSLSGDKLALSIYTGAIAVIVESALPFSFFGIISTVLYGLDLPQAPAFLFIWGTLCALAPQFIIFRVAMGRAWTRDIASQMSTGNISFSSGSTSTYAPTFSAGGDSESKMSQSGSAVNIASMAA